MDPVISQEISKIDQMSESEINEKVLNMLVSANYVCVCVCVVSVCVCQCVCLSVCVCVF